MIDKYLASLIYRSDRSLRGWLEKSDRGARFYDKRVLSLAAKLMVASDYRLFKKHNKYYDDYFRDEQEALTLFLSDAQRADQRYRAHLRKDMMKAFLLGHLYPSEYFLYRLENQGLRERKEWLSDWDRYFYLRHYLKDKTFRQLLDKSFFYQLAKPYFHREICMINKERDAEAFLSFTRRHPRFIVKPIKGSLGANTFITSVGSEEEAKDFYQKQTENGSWLVEELIVQSKETAAWNESSVNTVRVPSFRTADGVCILQPFFRTGRKGSVVDNAGHGGVFAVFDPETGVITTDGVDEHGGRYECHPDSGKKFKGWQIPRWQQLKALVKEIHHSLPEHHRYVGFDFALDKDQQWVLIEGNWGQMVGQMAELKGIRRPFLKLISSDTHQ